LQADPGALVSVSALGAAAVVGDADVDVVAVETPPNVDAAAGPGCSGGVVEQVVEGAEEDVRIAVDGCR
jgi:hypothetical protein